MQTGVVEIDGKIYYFGTADSGAMQTGKVTIDGIEYEFAESGEATGARVPQAEKNLYLSQVQ